MAGKILGDVNAAYHTGQMALHWSVVRGAIQVADQEGAHRRYVLQAFEAASLNYFSEILRSTCNASATLEDPNSKLLWRILLLKKINFISCEPMAHISDIKLIRTNTTLDLSRKAEKGHNFLVRCPNELPFEPSDRFLSRLQLLYCGRSLQKRSLQKWAYAAMSSQQMGTAQANSLLLGSSSVAFVLHYFIGLAID
ncbi:hypothetical protein LguiB_028355 [Lonicera macranthoides]